MPQMQAIPLHGPVYLEYVNMQSLEVDQPTLSLSLSIAVAFRSTVVTRWTLGNRSGDRSCDRDMIHNKIHLIRPCWLLSPSQYRLTVKNGGLKHHSFHFSHPRQQQIYVRDIILRIKYSDYCTVFPGTLTHSEARITSFICTIFSYYASNLRIIIKWNRITTLSFA